ncbi:AMP-binding protein [Frondihabitans cladoniiphilus]|uniref:AMP-dependent synthetase/ligase domain-containing protein n=1 Tax=Frondihabitans cladoniiphilus TaxID=715785 RepID=A0ABP8W9C7_9MICO
MPLAATRDDSVTALLTEALAESATHAAIAIPDSFGGWFDLSLAEFLDRAEALARGFLASGLEPGDRIGVLCSTRFESTLVDAATGLVGIATVPLPPEAGETELTAVLEASGARAVVVETPADFARFDEIHGDLPLVIDVWQIGLADLDKLVLAGRRLPDPDFEAAVATAGADTVLSRHYETTPDGGLRLHTLTHAVAAIRVRALAEVLAEATGPSASTLLVLPATDPHARLTTLLALFTGTRLGHLADPSALLPTLASFRPTLLVADPALFEGIDEAASVRAQESGRTTALRQARDVALEYATALESGSVPTWLKTRFALADALVLRGLRKTAGGRLRHAVALAGTASLPTRLRLLMRALDVHPLESYGTPETSGFATIEHFDDASGRAAGGVGRALDGVEVQVESDGAVRMHGVGIEDPAAGSGSAVAGSVAAGSGASGSVAAGSGASGEWLDLGLTGRLDDDGRLFLDDREGLLLQETDDGSHDEDASGDGDLEDDGDDILQDDEAAPEGDEAPGWNGEVAPTQGSAPKGDGAAG